LNDRGHAPPRRPGTAKPLGRFERPKARLQGECRIRFRRQRHHRQSHRVKNAESPGYLSFWSYATYDGADLVVLCRVASDSPASVEEKGHNESSDANDAGARNRTGYSRSTGGGRAVLLRLRGAAPIQTGIRRSSIGRSLG